MRVTLKTNYSAPLPDGGNVSGRAGDTIDVPQHNGESLLAGGYAELVAEPAVEAAAPETTAGEPPVTGDSADAAPAETAEGDGTDSTPATDATPDGTDATDDAASAAPPATKPVPAGGPPAATIRRPINLKGK